jgi:hypothetical protein
MCRECAQLVSVQTTAGGKKRLCPACRGEYTSVLAQPQLRRIVEAHAALLWPDVWAMFEKIKRECSMSDDEDAFGIASRFVLRADDDALFALRVLRISSRLLKCSQKGDLSRLLALEPLCVAEAGQAWDGYGPWLERVLAAAEKDESLLQLATAEAAAGAHAAVAPKMIRMMCRCTLPPGNDLIDAAVLDTFSNFAAKHMDCIEGGWAALVDTPSFHAIAPADEIASLFVHAPSPRLLCLLTASLKVQFVFQDQDVELRTCLVH